MPAALSHLKKINKCHLQCKHFPWSAGGISKQGWEGLWGWQRKVAQELQLLEETQGKIMGELFSLKPKMEPLKGASTWCRTQSQIPAPSSLKQLQEENLTWVLNGLLDQCTARLPSPAQHCFEFKQGLPRTFSGLGSSSSKPFPGCWGDALPPHTVWGSVRPCPYCITAVP